MSSGGLDPEWFKNLQAQDEAIKNSMQRAADVYEGVVQNLTQVEAFKRQIGLYAAQQQALQNTPWPPEFSVQPEVIRSAIETAADILKSPEFQTNLQEALETGAIAAQRFGTEGLIAAHELARQRLVAGPGLEQAVSRIQSGQADELLSEAAELAARPEVRETIENADREELLRRAETTDVAELDLEAAAHIEEVGEYARLSKEEVLKIYDRVFPLWLLIGAAIAAAQVTAHATVGPMPSLTTLMAAYSGLTYLLLFLGMQLRAQDDEDK